MSSILTGLASNAPGLYKALVGSQSLVQFCTSRGDTLVQFDAMITSTHTTTATPTMFPVEDGASISDHIIRQPLELQMSCIASDDPMGGKQKLKREVATVAASAIAPPLGVMVANTAFSIWQTHQQSDKPSMAAYKTLVMLQNGNINADPPTPPAVFMVKTRLGDFYNMVIKSIGVPRDKDMGNALLFNMTLQQITIVESQTLEVSRADVPGLAYVRSNLGTQSATDMKDTFRPGCILGTAAATRVIGTGSGGCQ